MILVCKIALHGESFGWAAVSTEYKLLMQISKSTGLVLYSHRKMTSDCDVTLELYCSYVLFDIDLSNKAATLIIIKAMKLGPYDGRINEISL